MLQYNILIVKLKNSEDKYNGRANVGVRLYMLSCVLFYWLESYYSSIKSYKNFGFEIPRAVTMKSTSF
jgi:hypothetical protein